METKTIETKHIFIDIVNYTYNRSVEAQTDLISYLNNFVKQAMEKYKINAENNIYIPTGDGMCISLLNISTPYDIHILISLDILEQIQTHNDSQKDEMRKFHIRIGINENIDNLIIDINGNKNISGSGINIASRIESLCDESQIIVGNSVFEKLVQREKYMNSFSNYSAEVKHGLSLKIHQYKNKKLKFLNNEIPSKFKPTPSKIFKFTEIQAYYLANCIKNEEFISRNVGNGQNLYSLQTILVQLSQDCCAKKRITRTNPEPRIKVERPLQEQFEYIQSIDFWLIADINTYNSEKYLYTIGEYFTEPYLFLNKNGKKKLLKDCPIICKQFGIE